MRRYKFLYISHAILALFLGIMGYVIVVAYFRHSGSTGMDMAAIQKLRHEALPKNDIRSSAGRQ